MCQYQTVLITVALQVCCEISSVQSLSRVQLFMTPQTAARQASLSILNSRSLLKLMSTELVMPFNHLILYHHVLLLPSLFPSIRVFSKELVLFIRWSKYEIRLSYFQFCSSFSRLFLVFGVSCVCLLLL